MGTYKIRKIDIPAAGRNVDYKFKGGLTSSSSFGVSGVGGSWLDQYFTFNTDTENLSISKPLKDYFTKTEINTELDKKVNNTLFDSLFELKTDGNGTQYIQAKHSFVSSGEISAYSTDDVIVPSIFDGLTKASKDAHGIVRIGSGLQVLDGVISVDGDEFNLSNYYTTGQLDGFLTGKANASHNHDISHVSNLSTALGEKALKAGDGNQDFHVKDLFIHGSVDRWVGETMVISDAKLRLNRTQGTATAISGLDIASGSDVVSSLNYSIAGNWQFTSGDLYIGANKAALQNVNIIAGNGLSGGGLISASRTLTLGTPLTITGATTNSVGATNHSHALDLTSATANNALNLNGIAASSYATQTWVQNTATASNAAKLGGITAANYLRSDTIDYFKHLIVGYNWAAKTNGIQLGIDGLDSGLSFYDGVNPYSASIFRDIDSKLYIGVRSGYRSKGITIDGDGKVGISNITPSAELSVGGNITATYKDVANKKVLTEELFELLTDTAGNPYIRANFNLASVGEVAAYASTGLALPSVFDAIPNASTTSLGLVQIGSNISVNSEGVISVSATALNPTLNFTNNILSVNSSTINLGSLAVNLTGYATEMWVQNTAVAYNAARLGGVVASSFLRSDVSDTTTGTITFNNGGNSGLLRGSDSQRMLIGGGTNWSGSNGAYISIEGNNFGGTGLGGNISFALPVGKKVSIGGSQIYTDNYHPSADNADKLGGVLAANFLRSDVSDFKKDAIQFYKSSTSAYTSMEGRDDGVTSLLHKWRNKSTGGYEPYKEAWFDGAAYKYLGADTSGFYFNSSIRTTGSLTVAGTLNSNFITSTGGITTGGDVSLEGAHGKGLRFWNSDAYKIYMSSTADGAWGGRLDSTSDYNMYFKMQGGTNRGFVFRNDTTNVAQIEANGNLITTGTINGVNSSDWARKSQNETITGLWTINRSGENTTLLKFETERPWYFMQTSAGSTAGLGLVSEVDAKNFDIRYSNGVRAANFQVGVVNAYAQLVPDGNGSIFLGATTTINADTTINGNVAAGGDVMTGTAGALLVRQTASNNSTTGLSLYGATSNAMTYGIQFMRTDTAGYGTHGSVIDAYAMYFNMSNTNTRGWIFRPNGGTNAASISVSGDFANKGNITTAGSITTGGSVNIAGSLTVGSTTSYNRTIKVLAGDGYAAGFEAYGNNQGTGYLYVGQDSNYGGGIEYNGDNNPVSTGSGADYVTLYRKHSGTEYWTARNYVSTNNWEFRGNLTAQGEVTAYSSSDSRLKFNIKPIQNALSIMDKINPVSFQWNDKAVELNGSKTKDATNYGVIAQEMELILPDLVHTTNGFKSVDYIQLTGLMLKAIKELGQQNRELKQAIRELKIR